MIRTRVVGFTAHYVTAVLTNLVPNVTVLVFRVVSDAIGGGVAGRLWKRNLVSRFA